MSGKHREQLSCFLFLTVTFVLKSFATEYPVFHFTVNMGSVQSVPQAATPGSLPRSASRKSTATMHEKFDAFKITEDHESDSMVIECDHGM